jgi:hypothetical protein
VESVFFTYYLREEKIKFKPWYGHGQVGRPDQHIAQRIFMGKKD